MTQPQSTQTIAARNALIAAVLTVLIWTAFIVIARASAMRALTAIDISMCRFVGAGLMLGAWTVWKLRQPGVRAQSFGFSLLPARLTVAAAGFAGIGYAFFAYSGFFFAPAAHASVLLPGLLPLWTALLAVLVLGERIAPRRAAALGLLALGALLVGGVSIAQALAAGKGVWKGDLLFMCGSFCWACYGIMLRKHPLDPTAVTAALSIFCLVTAVPVYAVLVFAGLVTSNLGNAPWAEIAFHVGVQGGLSVVVSGITFAMMVRHYGPMRSTMITALVPGLSAVAAALLLAEPLAWNVVLGLACVTLGIVLGVKAQSPVAKPGAA